ncbi:hypothetical protein [Chamaesiphon minutus]|uniref:hypothetical protein n=1 Tax=Chamaesiphon minutus TaxID=1173032 RepID=UPI0003102E2E|nr:hypothetical protein [Chamaesiphon minutus]
MVNFCNYHYGIERVAANATKFLAFLGSSGGKIFTNGYLRSSVEIGVSGDRNFSVSLKLAKSSSKSLAVYYRAKKHLELLRYITQTSEF